MLLSVTGYNGFIAMKINPLVLKSLVIVGIPYYLYSPEPAKTRVVPVASRT